MKTDTFKLPLVGDLMHLVKEVKYFISDEYRADEDDDIPGILLTVGAQPDGEWSYQTGDNSFMGGAYHYPHWAVVSVYRRSNSRKLAREIREELAESMAMQETT